jgi:hypothetical protein
MDLHIVLLQMSLSVQHFSPEKFISAVGVFFPSLFSSPLKERQVKW